MDARNLPLFWATLSALLLAVSVIIRRWNGPLSSLPGPWISRITDIVLKYHWLTGNRAKYVHSLHGKYGPVVRVGPNEVDISEHTTAKEIHRVGSHFMKPEFYRHLTRYDLQNLFNTSDPKFHRERRRLLSSPMSASSLKRMEPLIRLRVRLAIRRIQEEMETRGTADVYKWWMFMATDIIGELCFGDSFRMLEHGKKNQYSMDLESVSAMEAVRVAFPRMVSLTSVFPLPIFRNSAEAGHRMEQYANQSVQRYKKLIATDPNPKPILFTRLFGGGNEGLPETEIVNEAISFIIAGTDTTATTMTYLVWEVCRNPHIKKLLLTELAGLQDHYDHDDLRPLPYLNQVIMETLRLYTGVPSGLPRVSQHGATLGGCWIPAGVVVTTQAYSLHRIPSIFTDPEKFDPSRWENLTEKMKDAFMPFGGGSRSCIGVHLAQAELRLATAEFFRLFPKARTSSLEGMGAEDMDQIAYFLLSPKNKRCLLEVW
ncbi:putative cytochrome P450 [Aspergillus cavernicola]|uniref:Cytochrome P450 n=1 Tax=Aspergillus cavernicola TaxID=176166 RepID=A0ABR4IUT0_9EURO